ncbi:glycosyltransferase family 2 protein [Amnibacterium kyonggiense]|uniref:Dolichol-phosphate mannosyltransferase n=1 Tax=Amnibacterium kyonggiense TaxID=595671 RepID=A0A4R7FFI9_9MICO|nr:glycosyltransferase family 2 protein [Amnibacterium kyonggiense]TDS74961.1 dolichol-phosphate mannosyltransferase [Amnibacterium kyonggiense]
MSQLHEPMTPERSVPAHDVTELAPRSSRYCVLVFVINEGEKVRRQLAGMSDLAAQVDVVVADGGSTDGSLDLPSLEEWRVRALLTKRGPGKLSAQMRMAFSWALEQGYDGVVTIDGNGKDGFDAIPEFLRLLDDGVDHVQGSRFIPGGRAINTPLSRLIGVRLLHAPLISLAARERHTDTTNGFRAYSARLLADDRIAPFRDVFSTYELHYHLAIESSRDERFRTAETPVVRAYPRGKVPTKISPVRGNAHVLGVLARAVTGRYRSAS